MTGCSNDDLTPKDPTEKPNPDPEPEPEPEPEPDPNPEPEPEPDPDPTPDPEPEPEPEPEYQPNFRFLTFNGQSSTGDKPSISLINNSNSVILDMYKLGNGVGIGSSPKTAVMVGDRLCVNLFESWSSNNSMEVLDADNFKTIFRIDFADKFYPLAIERINGDTVLIAGMTFRGDYNALLGVVPKKAEGVGVRSLRQNADDGFTIKTFSLGENVSRVRKIGSKLFMGDNNTSDLMILDIDKLGKDINTASHIRRISNMNLSAPAEDYHVDMNGNVWFVVKRNEADYYGYKLICMDINTETVIKEVKMPSTVTTISLLVSDIDTEGRYIYLRNNKAFYVVDTQNPQVPDEPLFEYRAHAGSINDLKYTKDGTLLFIDQSLSPNTNNKLFEYAQNNGVWSMKTEFEVGCSAKHLFVP